MIRAIHRHLADLAAHRSGTALLEFALAFPLVFGMGGYGIEMGNLAITSMRLSQIALTLADNASRIGANNGQATFQLREGDLNDVLQGARLMGAGMKLTTFGRVTVSSLENVQQSYDKAAVQRIHWQRCIGMMTGYGTSAVPLWDSSYGQALPLTTAGTDATQGNAGSTSAGLGSAPVVNAPSGSGLIFVEVNYQYRPLFGSLFIGATKLHYVASFIVRDRRDFSQIYNPTPAATASSCDKPVA